MLTNCQRRPPLPKASAIWAAFYCEGPNYRGDCVSQQFSSGECTQVLPAYSNKILSFLTSSSNCMLYQYVKYPLVPFAARHITRWFCSLTSRVNRGSDCTESAVPIYSSVQDLRAFKKTNSYRCGLTSGLVATQSVPLAPAVLLSPALR